MATTRKKASNNQRSTSGIKSIPKSSNKDKSVVTATLADRIIDFHGSLHFDQSLPPGFGVLNPIRETTGVFALMNKFYKKFYEDNRSRKFIIGINPGRHGAGTTGIPFTDSKRMRTVCGIDCDLPSTHEVSALFIYDMIAAYGGVNSFYGDVYIQSMFPLALVREGSRGSWVNCNYYDDPRLVEALEPYMRDKLKQQVAFGVDQSTAYILGRKNARYFERLNQKEKLFEKMVVLAHPRYIQQYRSKDKDLFIDEYIRAFKGEIQ